MRGRGGTPNEAAKLLKRESGFKFHVFDQERSEEQKDKVKSRGKATWKRKYQGEFRRCPDEDQQEGEVADILEA